jgi:hypothetical protein
MNEMGLLVLLLLLLLLLLLRRILQERSILQRDIKSNRMDNRQHELTEEGCISGISSPEGQ